MGDRDNRGPMENAVRYALRHIPDDDKLAGTRALVRQYAALIDASAIPATYAEALDKLMTAAIATDDKPTMQAYRRVAAGLSAATVAGDLGPKLLAAMAALGMTATATGGGVPGGDPVGSTLAGLKQTARSRRQHAPAPADSPAATADA